MSLETIQNEDIFKYFIEISKIPRCSHKEEKIADYLEDFAQKNNLEYRRDDTHNLIIKKFTNSSSTIALQAHVDMVCIKSENYDHDFDNESLQLKLNGSVLSAEGTTLGADNGIGVSYMLALLADSGYDGPNLECIFTTNEEDGMTGAANIDLSDIRSSCLINIDSEDEGKLYVSCAGGVNCNLTIPIQYKIREGTRYKINISGLKGGHSGLEIDKGRGNAIKLAARILNYLQEESINYRVINISGGKKHNAIAKDAEIEIILKDEEQHYSFDAIINNCQNIFQKELKNEDPNIKVNIKKFNHGSFNVFSRSTRTTLIGVLSLIPDGVIQMSNDIENLVETSANIGIINVKTDDIQIVTSVRSSKKTGIDSIVERFQQLKTAFNIKFTTEHPYPGWDYNKKSKLREIAKDVYLNMYNDSMEEIAVHAGLECGFFKNKKADIDIISLGPTIKNIHTPAESIDIDSARRVYKYLCDLLHKLR